MWFTCCPGFVRLDTRRFSKIRPSKTLKQPIEDSDACSSFSTASNLSDPNFPGGSFIVSIFGPQNGYKQLKENTFLDLVPFLLDLDTFHGPYYNSFGDGCPSFGPAHPPAGPAHPPAGPGPSPNHPLRIDSPSWRLDRNSSDSRGLELHYSTMQHGRKHFSTLWFSASFPFLPSSQLLLFTPLRPFLSCAGAQLGVYLGESASLGDIHLVSISKLPPLCLSSNFLHFLHSLSFNIYTSPRP